ncbi:molybdenum cofactor guanylyltransferase [Candidatus Acetothermia bacterium]|nr:molybdenum cofactor guanylyltransferase [Candidatus Acetothermia bacterium]MBI3644163.1 molybdenum cofactor guanylyltransferase [Candidatus Acetothermia bacterium]
MRVSALILAGGESQRMGQDKRFLKLQGQPLIERTFQAATKVAAEVLILVAKSEDQQKIIELLGSEHRFLIDENPNSGPLGALIGGLQAMSGDYGLLLAVDFPLLTSDFLSKMQEYLQGLQPQPRALIPIDKENLQVTCALYHKSLYSELKDAFESGELSLYRWIEKNPEGIATLTPSVWQRWGIRENFTDVNRPDELQRLLNAIESGHNMSDNSQ